MSRKPKFNPEITRVKLNPEQAVLQCTCWTTGFLEGGIRARPDKVMCYASGDRLTYTGAPWDGSTASS